MEPGENDSMPSEFGPYSYPATKFEQTVLRPRDYLGHYREQIERGLSEVAKHKLCRVSQVNTDWISPMRVWGMAVCAVEVVSSRL